MKWDMLSATRPDSWLRILNSNLVLTTLILSPHHLLIHFTDFIILHCSKGSTIHQCDIKNAYLNSRLKDNITLYSELPPKYEDFHKLPPDLKGKPNVATQWFISVYGSKQGACDWYAEVKNFFTELGYSISAADEAVFYKIEDDKFTIVTTAINDFSIITDSAESTNLLIHKQLTKHF